MKILLNGLEVEVEKGATVLEAAKFYGIQIPTFCAMEGLTPFGGCRLCLVEVGEPGKTRIVSSCTYPCSEGLKVWANTRRVIKARNLMIELLLSIAPGSRQIQDLAAKWEVRKVRFPVRNEDCVLCGRCVRMCEEQMKAGAIGFVERGHKKRITTAFDKKSDVCRLCGGCMYVCPVCQARCQGWDEKTPVCNACVACEPPCIEVFDEMKCSMDPCVWCEKPAADRAKAAKKKPA
jgi:NADH dehydrogenase/NADH:ubiquinone oxidoreductase subunit G